jgi:quercetin dioxygenase-like cupin family protein
MDETPTFNFDGDDVKFEPVDGMPGLSVAQVHGDPATGPSSSLNKLSAGFDTGWHTHDYEYEALVLKGTVTKQQQGDPTVRQLPAGSYYVQPASMNHRNTCTPDGECIFYYHSEGPDTFNPMTAEGEPIP